MTVKVWPETVPATVSDDTYDATTWNGVTTIAPSKNAVRDQFEVLGDADTAIDERLDDLEGYRPGMMQYDGTSAYYSLSYTSSGNKVTFVCRFKRASFTGDRFERIFIAGGPTNYQRCAVYVFSSDYSDTDRANTVQVASNSSSNAVLCRLFSSTGYLDGEEHTLFYSFDGDIGAATFVIDGQAADDTGNADRVAPTTGTLDSGASSVADFGGSSVVGEYFAGAIGFAGFTPAYRTNWSDFMEADGSPKDIVPATVFGGAPLLWNPHGQMDHNLGSATGVTKNGTIELQLQGVESAWTEPDEELDARLTAIEPLSGTFTPVIWDNTLSSSESQTYTTQVGVYRKIDDLVFFSIEVTINSLGTLTTSEQARIGGLPFTSSNTSNTFASVHVGFADSLAITAGHHVSGTINVNQAHVSLWNWDATTGATAFLLSELSTGGRLILSGTYIAA